MRMRNLLLATMVSALAQAAWASEPAPATGSGLYLVEFTVGAAWNPALPVPEQAGFGGHSANLARLRKDGTLLFGARYADKGVILLKVPDIETARAALADDPALAAGVFVADIHEFRPFYPGEVPASGHPAAAQRP